MAHNNTDKRMERTDKQKPNKNTPLSQILDTFHKIKESRFQGKEKVKTKRHGVSNIRRTNAVSSDVQRSSSSNDLDTPKSKTINGKGRRMSLPSIFHPLQPLSRNVSHTSDRKLIVPVQGPRVSMSYLLQAYSKAEVEEVEVKGPEYEYQQYLAKEAAEKAAGLSSNNHQSPNTIVHKPGQSNARKRIQGYRKLPPLSLDENEHNSEGRRSRVFPI